MAITVTHTTAADGSFSAAGAAAWDANHTYQMGSGFLLGRGTAGTGAFEEITLGTNLSLSGTTLNATGDGGMTYPGAGIAVSTGSAWSTSITPGTGVATALAVNVGSAGAFVTFNGALGTPSSGTLTNASGLPISTGVSGLGTGVATALAVNVGSAGAPVTFNGALGTPSSATLTNATGLPVASGISGLGTGVATFLATPSSANLRSALSDETGTGAAVFASMPTFVGTKETVYTITDGAAFEINPANGGVQVVTLGASRTPAATNFAAGQSVLLGIDDGTAYTVTWTTVSPTWLTDAGVAPTLAPSGYTWIVMFEVSSTIYAARIA